MSELHLEELSASNVVAANSLTLKPGQEAFVAPVSHSIAMAYVNQDAAWPRVVLDGDDVVAFIMASFDPDAEDEQFRAAVWRINVAAERQGQGIGTYAVTQIADEARRRGFTKLTALWEPGALGPGPFFENFGFKVVGETQYGEHKGEYTL